MIRQIPVHEGNIVAYRVTGRLTHADYQAFLPELEKLIQERGRLSVLFELHNFRGWDLAAAWDDFRFMNEHVDDFERIAVVGSNRLERWMTAIASPFMSGEIRFFEDLQLGHAWDWLRESAEGIDRTEPEPDSYRNILVAIDFTSHSDRLVLRALQLASALDARVHLVHAVDYPIYYDEAYDPVVAIDAERELESLAKDHMHALLERMDSRRLSGETVPGSAKGVILSQAEALNADLVIMGKHSQGALNRLLGSTTNGVMHHARCEVLSIPLGEMA